MKNNEAQKIQVLFKLMPPFVLEKTPDNLFRVTTKYYVNSSQSLITALRVALNKYNTTISIKD